MRETQRIRKYINGSVNYHGKIYGLQRMENIILWGRGKNYLEVQK